MIVWRTKYVTYVLTTGTDDWSRPVSFVEDKEGDAAERDDAPVHEVVEAAGGGDDDINTCSPTRHITQTNYHHKSCGFVPGWAALGTDTPGWTGSSNFLSLNGIFLEDLSITARITTGTVRICQSVSSEGVRDKTSFFIIWRSAD